MQLFKDLVYLFFPDVCVLCNEILLEKEQQICIKCRFDLPLTEFTEQPNNLIEKAFYGRVNIQFASCLFYYKRKGVVQKLIHQLKYKNQEILGEVFGQWMGRELLESKRLPKIDIVVPVPIHKEKLKKRGYNQVAKFSQQIARSLKVDYNDSNLICVSNAETQTHKTRADRFMNVKEKFLLVDTSVFANKSILLIDDVITTGATIEACALQLQKSDAIKISITTIAFTS